MSLTFEMLTVGPLQQNCYLLAAPGSRNAVLVDPGAEAARLLAALTQRDLQLEAILLTHAHFDHVGAVADIIDSRAVPVLLHPADLPLYRHAAVAAASWGLSIRTPEVEPRALEHGQTLQLAGLELRVLHTPGHAPGHVAFHLPQQQLVLSGDALFRGGIGRTDLPFADQDTLLESIRSQLLTLPAETGVHPGHGPATTIGAEAADNPFISGFQPDSW
jgi:glyoxylase-like metal-dependent hydrolase (beta-lactamase superfamily II)